jgi:hypothetical protein
LFYWLIFIIFNEMGPMLFDKSTKDGILRILTTAVWTMLTAPLFSEIPASPIRLLQSSSQGCTVEFRLEGFKVDSLHSESKTYLRADFNGARHVLIPGDPMIPFTSIVLGLPAEGDVRVSISALDPGGQWEGVRLCPCPKVGRQEDLPFESYTEGDAYSITTDLPGPYFYSEEPEWLGPYRTVRIKIYPVQYNPAAGVLRTFSRMVLNVSINGQAGGASCTRTPADEAVYRSILLNYDVARQWR